MLLISIVYKPSESGQRGAILLLLLVMVVVMGLAAMLAGESWRSTMQRAREAELLWRGQQYQQAIARYYEVKKMLPAKFEDLLHDPRFPNKVRHLRKLYNDPMTGEDWEPLTDSSERITGVRSSSDLEPFKQDGFPEELAKLKGKSSYREWEFVFAPVKPSPTTSKTSAAPAPKSVTQ